MTTKTWPGIPAHHLYLEGAHHPRRSAEDWEVMLPNCLSVLQATMQSSAACDQSRRNALLCARSRAKSPHPGHYPGAHAVLSIGREALEKLAPPVSAPIHCPDAGLKLPFWRGRN